MSVVKDRVIVIVALHWFKSSNRGRNGYSDGDWTGSRSSWCRLQRCWLSVAYCFILGFSETYPGILRSRGLWCGCRPSRHRHPLHVCHEQHKLREMPEVRFR